MLLENKPYKLRVRLGNAEFEAEGDEAVVREQYNMFLKALPVAQNMVEERAASEDKPEKSTANHPQDNAGDQLIARAFSDERGVVSLRALPETKNRDADALLLLIYGHTKLKGAHDVFGTQVMKSARQSGLSIDRVDRIISIHKGFYMRGGARRGAKYTLNNQGVKKAEQILREMFD